MHTALDVYEGEEERECVCVMVMEREGERLSGIGESTFHDQKREWLLAWGREGRGGMRKGGK